MDKIPKINLSNGVPAILEVSATVQIIIRKEADGETWIFVQNTERQLERNTHIYVVDNKTGELIQTISKHPTDMEDGDV